MTVLKFGSSRECETVHVILSVRRAKEIWNTTNDSLVDFPWTMSVILQSNVHNSASQWPRLLFFSFHTLWPRQTVTTSQMTFPNAFSWMKMYKFCSRPHRSPFLRHDNIPVFNNIPVLVQIMAWRRPGAYMRHSATISWYSPKCDQRWVYKNPCSFTVRVWGSRYIAIFMGYTLC